MIRTAATRAARTRFPAPQAVATEKPWTKAAAWPPAKPAAALTATVFSNAVPSEPPTWLAALTVAEATPASRGSTRCVAVLKAGTITHEMPRPRRTSAGTTSDRYAPAG